MKITKSAIVENALGDEMRITINIRNFQAPDGTYSSVAIWKAKRNGLPDEAPFVVRWEPTVLERTEARV